MEKRYKHFIWLRKWDGFLRSIKDTAEFVTMFDAIALYGLEGKEPAGLSGRNLEYFNSVVRPDLDRQHQTTRTNG